MNFDMNISFFLWKNLISTMKDRRNRKIIQIKANYSESIPLAELAIYLTAKSALSSFAKCLARELGAHKFNVNLVLSGITESNLKSYVTQNALLLKSKATPLKRIARARDIVSVISFVTSEDSIFLTGETIMLNGGQTML